MGSAFRTWAKELKMIWGAPKLLPENSIGFSVQIQAISEKNVFTYTETIFLSKIKVISKKKKIVIYLFLLFYLFPAFLLVSKKREGKGGFGWHAQHYRGGKIAKKI